MEGQAPAMRNKLCWLAVGGLSFWIPAIVVETALQNANLWTVNIPPLAGLALLSAASWIVTKHLPKWGWVLAGIYILGPVSMMAPSVYIRPSPAKIPGQNTMMLLICLFPPMTLWLALLNGMIFAVLIATVILPLLAAYLKDRRPTA
jgi:hypothetical protein